MFCLVGGGGDSCFDACQPENGEGWLLRFYPYHWPEEEVVMLKAVELL